MTKDELRELFKKYMQHIGECEGFYFIPKRPNSVFSDVELKELKRIAYEERKS